MSDLRDSEVKVWTHTCTSFLGFSQDAAPVADGYTSAMGFALGEKSRHLKGVLRFSCHAYRRTLFCCAENLRR